MKLELLTLSLFFIGGILWVAHKDYQERIKPHINYCGTSGEPCPRDNNFFKENPGATCLCDGCPEYENSKVKYEEETRKHAEELEEFLRKRDEGEKTV